MSQEMLLYICFIVKSLSLSLTQHCNWEENSVKFTSRNERATTLYSVICKYEEYLTIKQMKGDSEFEIETDEHNSIFTSFCEETTRIHNHIEKAKSKRWFKDKQGQLSPHKYMKEKKREKGKGYTKGSPTVLSHRHVYLQFHGPPWLLRIAKGTLRQTCTP